MANENIAQIVTNNEAMTSRASRFRRMLGSDELEFIMEAHNGLSAIIAEQAGFKGIWASGLSMSAALGVRDNNEASWSQLIEVLEFMADATTAPIMMDGDTGFGNFNNFRRLVQKLEQRHIAAICIEDKLFPKTNSFIGEKQPLADVVEFCGKIKAGKDNQRDADFSIVARVEALIAGRGMNEALDRAGAYADAGADAILIHSKKSDCSEILRFKGEWQSDCPVVIVPTTYFATPTEEFRNAGISMVVWANHSLRASIGAMRNMTRRIFEEQSLADVEQEIPSVKEIFKLQNHSELAEAEKRYLPSTQSHMRPVHQ
ncbi:MAG: phosphoenolpyruvate mutase [Rhodospirillales bacterium]